MPWSNAVTFLFFLTCYTITECFISKNDRGPYLWPLPQKMLATDGVIYTINPDNFSFVWEHECDIISEAIDQYKDIIFSNPWAIVDPELPALEAVHLILKDQINTTDSICPDYPKYGDDESYSLDISNEGIKIEAVQVWGLLRGLETFSQLIYQDLVTKMYRMNKTNIIDAPNYSYRSIRIDTSTHFIAPRVLKKNLEAMAQNKLNVFQWKIIGKESWSLETKFAPRITRKGAYSPYHVYSHEDIKGIIKFARMKGIRVVPEVNLPGEMDALAKSRPDLVFSCGEEELLNLLMENAVIFLEKLLYELRMLFQDEFLHLGIEPSNISCWNTVHRKIVSSYILKSVEWNPFLSSIVSPEGDLASPSQTQQYFYGQLLSLLKKANFTPIILDQNVDDKKMLLPNTVIHLSSNPFAESEWETRYANDSEVQFIFSSCWQINSPYGRLNWRDYYSCDIPSKKDVNESLILGGNVLLNGEMVDGTNLLQTLWPVGAVATEKLWTEPKTLYLGEQKTSRRIHHQRCRMLRRLIPTSPLFNDGPCENEYLIAPSNKSVEEWYAEETTTMIPTTEPCTNPVIPSGGTTSPEKSENYDNGSSLFTSSGLLVLIIGVLTLMYKS